MNNTEMIICSIEYFSYLKNVPSNKVYEFFQKKGILDMLLENAPVFTGMDAGFLIGVIDGYLESTYDAEESDFLRYEERTALLPKAIAVGAKALGITELEAMEKFYTSKIGEDFAQDASGLYEKTPEELADIFIKEQQ